MWTSYYACKKTCRKKYERFEKKYLIIQEKHGRINPRDI